MHDGLAALSLTALSVGFVHTLMGPDHYVPFVAMARAGRWSLTKTMIVTLLCGLGHVGSSVALGLVGVALGVAVVQLQAIEALRGDIAGWLLVAFGVVYSVYGIRRAVRHRPHTHIHAHADGTIHAHRHVHESDHVHAHETTASAGETRSGSPLTPWVLFTIFLFGPCEPLIPLVMYPAAEKSLAGVLLVTALFGLATLVTMVGVVVVMYAGVGVGRLAPLGRYGHAIAGLVILVCGVAVKAGL